MVKGQGHLIAVEIDLQYAVERLTDDGEFVERCLEQVLLHRPVDGRDQDNKAGMQRLRRVEWRKSLALLVTRMKSPSLA